MLAAQRYDGNPAEGKPFPAADRVGAEVAAVVAAHVRVPVLVEARGEVCEFALCQYSSLLVSGFGLLNADLVCRR
jgi:hypothetical protein